jgi:hypothetical protein
VGAGRLSKDADRRQESVKYVLGLGCVHILNVGFESLDQIDNFSGHLQKTPVITA